MLNFTKYPNFSQEAFDYLFTGGVAPYGFLWAKVSGDGVNIIDSTEQNARVQAFTCPNDLKTGRYSVTVQDSELESVTGTFDVSWEKATLE